MNEQILVIRQDLDAVEAAYHEWLIEIGSTRPTQEEVEHEFAASLTPRRQSQLAFAV